MLPDTLQTSTKNHMNALSTYRTENVNGRDFLVVDGVALVEGVLNNRFVPYEEFEFAPDWNGVPVVVRHPKKNKGSARVPKPDVLEVGRFYNARTDKNGRRLLGEFWLDQTLMNNDPDAQALAQAVLSNRRVEVSTGYFSADEIKRGKHNGVDYISIDRNIRPDHIALLPDEMGACSIKDGCGLNRNAKQNCEECVLRNAMDVPSAVSEQEYFSIIYLGRHPNATKEEVDMAWEKMKNHWLETMRGNSYHEDYAEFERMYKENHPDADEEEIGAAWEKHKAGRKETPMEQNAADQLDVSDDVAAFLRAAMRGNVRVVENHMGPGDHPNGTPQSVHGGPGGTHRKGEFHKVMRDVKKELDSVDEFQKQLDENTPYRVIDRYDPIMGEIDAQDTGNKLAYGIEVGDDVAVEFADGSSEIGIARYYKDDHFYVAVDAGIVEVYKTKVSRGT